VCFWVPGGEPYRELYIHITAAGGPLGELLEVFGESVGFFPDGLVANCKDYNTFRATERNGGLSGTFRQSSMNC
jgi:hypothetical protein